MFHLVQCLYMFENFLLKGMLKKHLAHVPKEQQDKLIKVVEDNPQLFAALAKEVQAKMKAGKDQMTAVQEVFMDYQEELGTLMK